VADTEMVAVLILVDILEIADPIRDAEFGTL
jgi:hypothetical protein